MVGEETDGKVGVRKRSGGNGLCIYLWTLEGEHLGAQRR